MENQVMGVVLMFAAAISTILLHMRWQKVTKPTKVIGVIVIVTSAAFALNLLAGLEVMTIVAAIVLVVGVSAFVGWMLAILGVMNRWN